MTGEHYITSEQSSRDASTANHRPAHHQVTMKMPRPSPVNLLLLAASLLALAWPASCGHPVLIPVAKDPATSLYTILIRDAAPHLVDLAGPLLWSTCAADHLPAPFPCNSTACIDANAYRAPTCHIASQPCKNQCRAYPYNPITGKCAAASLVHTRLVANTTDGKTPLQQVSVRAVAACAPPNILASMPKDVTGVAGLSAAGLALPAQVAASSQGVARKFLLCLPRRGEGVAIFGGGPLFLLPESSMGDLTMTLTFTRLVNRKDNPLYYIPVLAIAVNRTPVTLPANALAGGGVVLCSRVQYTALRPDVYRPVVDAFERALARSDAKVPAVGPFELCYRSSKLGNTRLGYAVPDVALVLEDGRRSWTFTGSSSMVDVDGQTACFAFVEMKGVKAGDPSAAAVVVGGFQMENHLLQFDLEKMQLGFTKVPFFSACSNFNFTKGSQH